MNEITAVVIEADGTAYCIDVGTSVRELSGAINAPEAVCVWREGGICAFADYDYCEYQPIEDYNAAASGIMSENDSDGIEIYGAVLFAGDISDDDEPESLTHMQVTELLEKARKYSVQKE